MRYLIFAIVLVSLSFPAPAAAREYETIGELVGAYNDEKCAERHAAEYDEWKATPHAQAVKITLDGPRNFFVLGVRKWWGREVTFLMHFGKETRSADIEGAVTYCLSWAKCDVVHTEKRTLKY